jgi:hypothetical protein
MKTESHQSVREHATSVADLASVRDERHSSFTIIPNTRRVMLYSPTRCYASEHNAEGRCSGHPALITADGVRACDTTKC